MVKEKIKLKAMCLFVHKGKVLVAKGSDDLNGKKFYRVVGGSVEFFETAEQGVRREIREELLSEIENLKFLDIVENLFTFEGKRGHEVVFLYIGDLAKKELYEQKTIRIIEPAWEIEAEWIPIEEILSGKMPLYPEYDYKKVL